MGGLLGGALGRMFGGSPQFMFVFYRPDRRENILSLRMMVSSTYNEHREVLFFQNAPVIFSKETKSSLYGPYTKYINIYVYI